MVLLELSKVDSIFSVNAHNQFTSPVRGGREGMSGKREEIVSMIVSVFSRTVKNRLLSRGLNLTVRHLSLQSPGIPKRCVHWDIQTQAWSEAGNTLLQTNSTHSSCHFKHLSTYAVLTDQGRNVEDQVTTILILSLTAIFLLTVSTILLILCWKRIRIFHKDVTAAPYETLRLLCWKCFHRNTNRGSAPSHHYQTMSH